jgi:hypothetical protein
MITAPSEGWIVVRSRVSLAGRVTGTGGDIAGGGVLNLTAAKDAVAHRATSPTPDKSHRYDARIRPDGFYFFLDLPSGDYVLGGRDEHGNEIEAKRVSIPPAAGSGPLNIVGADLIVATKSGAHRLPAEASAPAGHAGVGAVPRADARRPPMHRRKRR